MDSNLRNFKDFLTLYNKVTEMCFSRCVDNLNDRNLASHEDVCVDRCVTKFARFNQNMMNFYVEVQTTINAKRMEEVEEKARVAAQQQKEERHKEEQRLKELAATAVLTPVSPTAPGNLSI
ncbi:mitochondrial import inner membrane translocase subunit Tim10B [Drosophila serrata]|uniref:mitochondrial import inner membrane translocase subunit Tim10B n=1 Tax=Drosophila serrata TaxID=7274 RepID=UPI000A1CF4C8|nr:mitochondrial import inner membrane translocase subunit Tim10B [Drosophila serrata]